MDNKRPEKNALFSTIKISAIFFIHDLRSIPRHVDDIVSEKTIINSNIIGFTETQIKPSDSTSKIKETLNLFNISFNSNKAKYLNLGCRCRNDIRVLNKFDANGLSILNFKKYDFVDRVFTLMLV